MRTYYIYLLDHDGHITTRVNVDCAGDAAAVDEAWELYGIGRPLICRDLVSRPAGICCTSGK